MELIISIIVGVVVMLFSFLVGSKYGEKRGMEKFLSILKVYNNDLVKEISKTLHSIGNMSDAEKEAAFTSYVNEYMGGIDD